MHRKTGLAGTVLAGVALVTAGCGGDGGDAAKTKTKTSPVAAPSTPSASAPAVPPEKPRRTLKPGVKNADVKALQKRLAELNYDPGRSDGSYGASTVMAVYAFKKVNGLAPTVKVGKKTWQALANPKPLQPLEMKKPGKPERVEINLRKQLVVVFKKNEPVLITHSSHGHGRGYCERDDEGVMHCGSAATPTGDYRTGRHAYGWEKSPLGMLYKSVYFNGGIAVHGAPSVPLFPASHGCVRIPIHTADKFNKMVGVDVPVHVRRPKK